jgi:hypothetical protein
MNAISWKIAKPFVVAWTLAAEAEVCQVSNGSWPFHVASGGRVCVYMHVFAHLYKLVLELAS